MSPDLHTLTGAYAVHALPDDEREVFEEHLRVCDACAQEVAELVATAARLGAAAASPTGAAAPPGLRDAVLTQLPHVRQEAPVRALPRPERSRTGSPDARRAWLTNLVAPAAAVVAIAVLGLSAIVANLNGRLDQLETASSQLTAVMVAPDLETIETQGPGGSLARVALAESRGEAVFVVDGMDPAADGHDYALWLIGDDDAVVPAGVFDPDVNGRATRIVTGDLRGVSAVGVTAEPAGEPLVAPTSDPLMVIDRAATD